jgi:hypothetical protein
MKTKSLLITLALLPVLNLQLSTLHAQGTAFTYQGRLSVSGNPANGRYDLIFQVFDAANAGNSNGGSLTTNSVPVTNGLFAVTLDFGSTPFTGPARWLQIQVSTNGAGAYSTLSPRQSLTPAPYANYAYTAGTVTNGAITSAQLAAGAVNTSQLAANAVDSSKIASSQVVKSLNALRDDVTLVAGANVTLNTVGNSLQISAPAGGLALPYSGTAASASSIFTLANSGSGPSGVFLGNVGIGTTSPQAPLHVVNPNGNYGQLGTAQDGVEGYGNNLSSAGVFGRNLPTFNYGGLGSSTAGAFGVYGDFSKSGYLGTAQWGTAGYNNAANNGAGAYGQHVQTGNYGYMGSAGYGVEGASLTSGGVGVNGDNVPSGNYGQLGTADAGVFGTNAVSGNWGELAGYEGVHGYSPNGGIGVHGYSPGGIGVFGESHSSYGVLGSSSSSDGVNGQSSSGYGVSGNSSSGAGVAATSNSGFGVSAFSLSGIPGTFRRDNDGTLIEFDVDVSIGGVGSVSVSGNTVSYNAFTGSHYAWTAEKIERGTLVRLTGVNRLSGDDPNSEIIYGIVRTTNANDPRCLGSFLGLQSPSKPVSRTNSDLVMAVGNGDMWVTDGGSGDLEPGNYLISSDVPGCAMKDDPDKFPVGYICARAAEGVKWSEVAANVNGIKRKKISVLFETFERDSCGAQSAPLAQSQQRRIDALENEVKSLRPLQDRLNKLERLMEQQTASR